MPDMWRRLGLALTVAGALCGAVRASGDTPYPVLYVSPSDQATGVPVTLSFRAFHLAEVATTARITIAIPAAYGVHIGAGSVAGRAEVRRARRVGGRATLYTGRIVAARRTCGPRAAAASWEVQVRSKAGAELRLPLALAQRPARLRPDAVRSRARGHPVRLRPRDPPGLPEPEAAAEVPVRSTGRDRCRDVRAAVVREPRREAVAPSRLCPGHEVVHRLGLDHGRPEGALGHDGLRLRRPVARVVRVQEPRGRPDASRRPLHVPDEDLPSARVRVRLRRLAAPARL